MKYIRKKIIKGIEYFYFEFNLRVAKDKRITFTRYIGKNLLQGEELRSMIKGFFFEISSLIIKNIDKKTEDYFPPNGISKIERSRAWFFFINHELCEQELKLFKGLFAILFVLNSNRAEGSRVKKEEIEQIIKKKKKPRTLIDREIINSLEAMNFAFSNKMKWDSSSVKKIHKILFKGLDDEIAGKYKKEDNVVGQGGIASTTSSKEEVNEDMAKLMRWLKNNKHDTYIPILALKFHWKFEQIHPFQDGNGRVGRILFNALMMESNFMPVVFFSENHKAYSSAIAKAIEGRDNKIAKYFISQVQKTIKRIKDYKDEKVIEGGSSSIGRWEIQKGSLSI